MLQEDTFTLIEYKQKKFVIFDSPNDDNSYLYINKLKKHNVKNIVSTCVRAYDKKKFENSGIKIHDLVFSNGGYPSESIINQWFNLIDTVGDTSAIGVHCVSGLGRAPVLVALSLIRDGMEPCASVKYIRDKRHYCFNEEQIKYLNNYTNKSYTCNIL